MFARAPLFASRHRSFQPFCLAAAFRLSPLPANIPNVLSPVDQSRGILRPLFRLVWPVLVEQLLAMLVGFSDTLLAGHYLTESHLAAMTLLAYLLWALFGLFSVIAIGSTALVARFVGAGDYHSANRVTNQSLLVGVLLALAVTAVCLALGERLVWALQLEGEAADLAARYLKFLLPMVPAMMLEAVIIACLHGAGDTVTGLVSMALVNVANIAISWSLILGLGPLPKLGWDGIAIGTSVGFAIGGLVPLVALARGRAGLKLDWRLMPPDWQLVRRLLRIGLPGGADVMSVIGCQLLFLSLVNHLGTLAVAAHGVALRVESLAYLPCYAFQVAAGTLAGQSLGARDVPRAMRSVLVACASASSLMLVASGILYFGADRLSSLFVSAQQESVAEHAAPLIRIVAFVMVPLGLLQVLTGALRGAGDTRWPLAITFVGFLGIRLPLAWWLAFSCGWGVSGAWFAMAVDLAIRCLLIVARFTTGGWKRIEV
jgi:putative MATE family efflux protein